jgi:transposase
MLRVQMTEPEREVLEQQAVSQAESTLARKRARAVLLKAEGVSTPGTAQEVGASVESIRKWVKGFNANGLKGLEEGYRSGRPRVYTDSQVEIVLTTARIKPQELGLPFMSWTFTRLAEYVSERHGIRMSRAHIGRVLQNEGIRWHTQDYVEAVRGLRELKPNADDLDIYLSKTGLDTLIAELARTFREAGYASALSARSGLVWSGRIESLVTLIREAEVEAIEGAMWVVKHHDGERDAFTGLLENWRDQLLAGEYKLAFEQDEAFHQKLLALNRRRLSADVRVSPEKLAGYDEKLKAVKYALEDISTGYTLLSGEPETWARAGYYGEQEEWVQFLEHLEIARAMWRGDQPKAEELMRRHYSWLWHSDPSDTALPLPKGSELFDERDVGLASGSPF